MNERQWFESRVGGVPAGTVDPWYSVVQKLRPEQIAQQTTWGRVPDVDMSKAAAHVIRVRPTNAFTVAEMFELDPGISGETVSEGRGWAVVPSGYAHVIPAGRGMR